MPSKSEYPRWTVTYNIVSPENGRWIGRGWEFFDEELEAMAAYERHGRAGNCATMRPFYRKTDIEHMGAAHQHLRTCSSDG